MSIITFFIFITAVALSEQHGDRYNTYNLIQRKQHLNDLFEDVVKLVKEADVKTQGYCERFNNGGTKETFDLTRYTLQTALADFLEEDVTITIRHRVLYIVADKADVEKKYVEIRQLPSIADARGAKFSLQNGDLKITFPLKNTTVCTADIDVEVIKVPVSTKS